MTHRLKRLRVKLGEWAGVVGWVVGWTGGGCTWRWGWAGASGHASSSSAVESGLRCVVFGGAPAGTCETIGTVSNLKNIRSNYFQSYFFNMLLYELFSVRRLTMS